MREERGAGTLDALHTQVPHHAPCLATAALPRLCAQDEFGDIPLQAPTYLPSAIA